MFLLFCKHDCPCYYHSKVIAQLLSLQISPSRQGQVSLGDEHEMYQGWLLLFCILKK